MQTQAVSALPTAALTLHNLETFYAALSVFASDKKAYLAVYGQKFLAKYMCYLNMSLGLLPTPPQWMEKHKKILAAQVKLLGPLFMNTENEIHLTHCLADLEAEVSNISILVPERKSDFITRLHNLHAENMRNANPLLKFFPDQLLMPFPDLSENSVMTHYKQRAFVRQKYGEANAYYAPAVDESDDTITFRLTQTEEEHFQTSQHALVRVLCNFVTDAKAMHAFDTAISLLNTILAELQIISATFQDVQLNDLYHRELSTLHYDQGNRLISAVEANQLLLTAPFALKHYKAGLRQIVLVQAQSDVDRLNTSLLQIKVAEQLSVLAYLNVDAVDNKTIQNCVETIDHCQRAISAYETIDYSRVHPNIKDKNIFEMAMVKRLVGIAEFHNQNLTVSLAIFAQVLQILEYDCVNPNQFLNQQKFETKRWKSLVLQACGRELQSFKNYDRALEAFAESTQTLESIPQDFATDADQTAIANNHLDISLLTNTMAISLVRPAPIYARLFSVPQSGNENRPVAIANEHTLVPRRG
jgi:tetratricopeptide (TPR) repeat protein